MIDPAGDVPVYLQLAALLRADITSGKIPPHRPLPSISYLQQTYGVADQTARKAVGVLRADGLVHTVPGKGTFVNEPPDSA
jgi:GntR family transcriptional regulator